MYILKRINQGGGFVAAEGSKSSYTFKLENARQFPTKKAAEANRCPENEVVLDLRQFVSLTTR